MDAAQYLPTALPFEKVKSLFASSSLHDAERANSLMWGWKDFNSVWQAISTGIARMVNISPKEYEGHSDAEIPHKISEFADIFTEQDLQAMQGKPQANLDIYPYENNIFALLSKKVALTDDQKNVVGVFVQANFLQDKNLIELINLNTVLTAPFPCTSVNLIDNTAVTSNAPSSKHVSLTTREHECLFYLLRGFTLRHTAEALGLSPRTIESHVNNLKVKFNCRTKPELIEKAIALGYLDNIPNTLLSRITLRSLRDGT